MHDRLLYQARISEGRLGMGNVMKPHFHFHSSLFLTSKQFPGEIVCFPSILSPTFSSPSRNPLKTIRMDHDRNIHISSRAETSKSILEDILEVTPLASAGPNVFTNAQPLWRPPDARGIYGGICIAQSLKAAQSTIPSSFVVHSMHGQFVLAGMADKPLLYQVSVLNDGKSFATRTVKAVQEERTIFIATINLVRETNPRSKNVEHAEPMPQGVPGPPDSENSSSSSGKLVPYMTKTVGLVNANSKFPHERQIHHWSKASDRISASADIHTHLAALAYICDNYLVGTIPHVQMIWDFVKPPLTEFDVGGKELSRESSIHTRIPASDEGPERPHKGERRRIGMMVTLSHTMFFHSPSAVKADEWMLSELTSHWAGDGRGIATQKIWSKDDILIASCVQEGVIRLADRDYIVTGESKSRL